MVIYHITDVWPYTTTFQLGQWLSCSMICAMKYQTSWHKDLGGRDYPRDNISALFRHNLVIPTHKMCSSFRSKGKGGNKELERDNSMKELAYSNFWDSKCPGTRTNLFFITFLLFRGRKELRRCFFRVLSSRDTLGEVSNSMTSTWASSGINVFASSRTDTKDNIEWVWRLTSTRRDNLKTRKTSISSRQFISNIWFNHNGSYRKRRISIKQLKKSVVSSSKNNYRYREKDSEKEKKLK